MSRHRKSKDATGNFSNQGLSNGDALRRGGRFLLVRQVAGIALALLSALLVTRLIGPTSYGVYASAFGIAFMAQTWGELNLDVYIVRWTGREVKPEADQVLTLLVLLAIVTTGILVGISWLLTSFLNQSEYVSVYLAMFLGIPLVHLQQVPLSILERDLRYPTVGAIEFTGQFLMVATSVGLAIAGAGVWAPVGGWFAQQALLLVGVWLAAQYRPRLAWNGRHIRELLAYGVTATAATAAYGTRTLIAPLLVGSTLGPAAVGYVSLATRLVEQAAFIRALITRMTYSVVGRLAHDIPRLRSAVQRASGLQIIAAGVPVALLAVLSPWIIPLFFGLTWIPTIKLLGLLAPGTIVTAAFTPHIAVLIGKRRPWEVTAAYVLNAGLMWLTAILLIPAFGLIGYGLADIASISSWFVIAKVFGRAYGPIDYKHMTVWMVALSVASFAPVLSPWLLCVSAALLVNPPMIRYTRAIITDALGPRLKARTI